MPSVRYRSAGAIQFSGAAERAKKRRRKEAQAKTAHRHSARGGRRRRRGVFTFNYGSKRVLTDRQTDRRSRCIEWREGDNGNTEHSGREKWNAISAPSQLQSHTHDRICRLTPRRQHHSTPAREWVGYPIRPFSASSLPPVSVRCTASLSIYPSIGLRRPRHSPRRASVPRRHNGISLATREKRKTISWQMRSPRPHVCFSARGQSAPSDHGNNPASIENSTMNVLLPKY